MKHLLLTPKPTAIVNFSRRGLSWLVEACLLQSDKDIRVRCRVLTYRRAQNEARNLAAFLAALTESLP